MSFTIRYSLFNLHGDGVKGKLVILCDPVRMLIYLFNGSFKIYCIEMYFSNKDLRWVVFYVNVKCHKLEFCNI